MKISLYALAAALLLILSDRACAESIVGRTEVNGFTPPVPSGPIREGSCWIRSIATDRLGAWRCMMGNGIQDPCFQVPPQKNEVICDANPALGKSCFVMKLTKALPLVTAPPAASPSPWILQREDGSVCEPFTETRPAVNNQPPIVVHHAGGTAQPEHELARHQGSSGKGMDRGALRGVRCSHGKSCG